MVLKTVYFHKKRHFAASLKENKIFFREKNSWIRRCGIPENMSRTSYKTFSEYRNINVLLGIQMDP